LVVRNLVYSIAALAFSMSWASAQTQDEQVFVPDLKLCALPVLERNEITDTLYLREDKVIFEAIEYYCEFEGFDPKGWQGTIVQTRVGYCNEPGFWTPEMRVFMVSDYETNTIGVSESDGAMRSYFRCPQ